MFCLEINEASVKAKIRSWMIVNHLLHSSAPIKDTICLFDLSITNAVNLQYHGFKPLTLHFSAGIPGKRIFSLSGRLWNIMSPVPSKTPVTLPKASPATEGGYSAKTVSYVKSV